jgi:hypothetical protein
LSEFVHDKVPIVDGDGRDVVCFSFVLVFLVFCKLFSGGLNPIVIVLDVWNLANAFHCGEKLVILMGFLAVVSDGALEEQLFKKCNVASCGN